MLGQISAWSLNSYEDLYLNLPLYINEAFNFCNIDKDWGCITKLTEKGKNFWARKLWTIKYFLSDRDHLNLSVRFKKNWFVTSYIRKKLCWNSRPWKMEKKLVTSVVRIIVSSHKCQADFRTRNRFSNLWGSIKE